MSHQVCGTIWVRPDCRDDADVTEQHADLLAGRAAEDGRAIAVEAQGLQVDVADENGEPGALSATNDASD